jgi:hypothetical protein
MGIPRQPSKTYLNDDPEKRHLPAEYRTALAMERIAKALEEIAKKLATHTLAADAPNREKE